MRLMCLTSFSGIALIEMFRNKALFCKKCLEMHLVTCAGQSSDLQLLCKNLKGRLMTPTMQTLINEHLSLTCSVALQPRKRNSSQGSGGRWQEGPELGSLQGTGGAIKHCLPSLSLPQGPLVLPIKLWESHGCNEVPGNQSGHYSPIKLPSVSKWKHKPKTLAWL